MMSVQQSPAAVTSSAGRKIKTKKAADKIKGIVYLFNIARIKCLKKDEY